MAIGKNALGLTVSALTDPGRVRPSNQDWWGQFVPPNQRTLAEKGALFAVADGMGGRVGGEIASQLAIQYLLQAYYRDPSRQIDQSLARAVQAANRQVHSYGYYYPAYQGMATTLVVAVVQGQDLVVAHVGDSRAYLARAGRVWPLTRDHSWVAEMVVRGALTPAEAARHPYRHVISRSIGPTPEVQVDVRRLRLSPGDTLVLCTDGLSDLVNPSEIGWAASRLAPPHAVQSLVRWANERGGRDNISALVVRADRATAPVARTGNPLYYPSANPAVPGAGGLARTHASDTTRWLIATGLAAASIAVAMYSIAL